MTNSSNNTLKRKKKWRFNLRNLNKKDNNNQFLCYINNEFEKQQHSTFTRKYVIMYERK